MPSGEWCECTPAGGVDLATWNGSHSRRWNHFRTLLRREYPRLEFFRGVEVQDRGALHDHAMVWSPVALRKAEVRSMALAAGFGHSVDLAPAPAGSKRAAYYVAKYVTKATDSRDVVPWFRQLVDVDTGEVTDQDYARYRTWSCSRQWGLTMAAVRAAARAWVQAREAELFDQVVTDLGRSFGDSSPPIPDS